MMTILIYVDDLDIYDLNFDLNNT